MAGAGMPDVRQVSAVDDLIAFLRARLAEDEQLVLALDETAYNGVESTAGADARAHLERAAAEVEAKRKLIELYLMTYETSTLDSDAWTVMKDAMRTLALPHAEHPDYRPEWRS